jgi:hypothetical protein
MSIEIFQVGNICEIRMAYSMETSSRSEMDEWACCECEILEVKSKMQECLVWVKGKNREIFVNFDRLKKIR